MATGKNVEATFLRGRVSQKEMLSPNKTKIASLKNVKCL